MKDITKKIDLILREAGHAIHKCEQCGKDMGNEWFLGPVCGKCCRENHRKAMGGGPSKPPKEGTMSSPTQKARRI